jgi:hypothetical protein
MHNYKGIKYYIKRGINGPLLVIPAFNVCAPVSNEFKKEDIIKYV